MLSGSQKLKIIRILGFPFGTLSQTSVDFNRGVVQKLDLIDGEAQIEVETILTSIDSIEAQRTRSVSQAGIKRIDDIEFSGDQHITLKNERDRAIRELSSLIGIPYLKGHTQMGEVWV